MKLQNSRRWVAATAAICVYLCLSATLGSQNAEAHSRRLVRNYPQNPQTDTTQNAALVDYDADAMQNLGDGITRLIGNVRFHHNGAIIQCDSAFQYEDQRMEFFGNVIIEKDSALIYGDRVLYNGDLNIADVFAPIVKMVRGDATMYSYNLQFNTVTSTAYYHSGGVMSQGDNLMESQRGFFEANRNYIRLLDSVSLSGEGYVISTDSLGFELEEQRVDFLTLTHVWDQDRDFLRASGGNYFSTTSTYLFTDSAYMMTPENELWADTIRYLTALKQAYLFRDVQLLDTVNQTVAFGQWGYVDDSIGRAILTDRASVRAWQLDSLNRPDTSYMRADTILLLTLWPESDSTDTSRGDIEARDIARNLENSARPTTLDTMRTPRRDSTALDTLLLDTLSLGAIPADSLVVDTLEPNRAIRAYHNVRSWNPSHQSRCDSMVVYSEDSTATMFGTPVLWSQSNQITAEQIDMYTTNQELDWCNFDGSPFIAQQIYPDDTTFFNQAEGRTMEAYFKNNSLDYTILSGNVKNIYYMQDGNRLSAYVRLEASELTMQFEDQNPTKMTWKGSGEGPIHPVDNIPPDEPRKLKGFVWMDSLRPKSAAEISPQLQKPSLRAKYQKLPLPIFNINAKMEQAKDSLQKSGVWRDRSDWPSVTSEYFLQRNDQLLF